MAELYEIGVTDFCSNCRYFALHDAGDPVKAGDCRVNPPSHNGFPMTYAEKWCREHEPNAELWRQRTKIERDELIKEVKESQIPGRIFHPESIAVIKLPALQTGKTFQLKRGDSYDT